MKKLVLAFTTILLFATSFVSCKKNEEATIVGTWDTWNETSMKEATIEIPRSITFNSDGTWTGSTTGTSDDFVSGTYSVSGKSLKFVEFGITYDCTIKLLSNSRLAIYWSVFDYTSVYAR
jgi:hypothetical protein